MCLMMRSPYLPIIKQKGELLMLSLKKVETSFFHLIGSACVFHQNGVEFNQESFMSTYSYSTCDCQTLVTFFVTV